MQIKELQEKAKELRREIFAVICNGGGGHIPACLSIVEILTVLYHRVLRIDSANPKDPDRDRFILSKGHAAVALYAVLADKGFLRREELYTYGKSGTNLGGHPDMYKVAGVEASTGALGHGFAFGVGVALAGKMDGRDYRVYCLLGDGECQEGSVWEAAMFAAQHRLDSLTAIIDYNKLQALDRLDKIVSLEPLADKWRAFGWEVKEIDGNDVEQVIESLEAGKSQEGKPKLIVAHTVKGKGISFMENVPIWHYRLPNEEEMRIARDELGLEEELVGK